MIRGNIKKSVLIAAWIVAVWSEVAMAGSIGIAPLRVDFDTAERNSVVRIVNTGAQTITMQVEALDWSQADDGRDQYEATADVIAVPPIFTVEPGETQLVRVGFLPAQLLEQERSYRLLFTELPPPMIDRTVTGLQIRLRVSIPAFSQAVSVDEPELELIEHEIVEDGRLRVKLKNPGNTHIRVAELTAFGLRLDRDIEQALDLEFTLTSAKYLLSGSSMDFYFEVPPNYSITRLRAATDSVGMQEFDTRNSTDRLRAINEQVGSHEYEVTTVR